MYFCLSRPVTLTIVRLGGTASLDGVVRNLVTVIFIRGRRRPAYYSPPPLIARIACRVSNWVRPPGTRARTIACPTRGGIATPCCANAYSLSPQVGTNLLLKRRSPSKL